MGEDDRVALAAQALDAGGELTGAGAGKGGVGAGEGDGHAVSWVDSDLYRFRST